MNVRKLEQGSDEWRQWRNGKIGASDAPTIMGVKGIQAQEQLQRRILTGEEPSLDHIPAIQFGKKKEEPVRAAMCERLGKKFLPICLDHPFHPFLSASLDGWDCAETALEIKCFYKRGTMEAARQHGLRRWRAAVQIDGYYWQLVAQFSAAPIVQEIILAGYPVPAGESNIATKVFRREEMRIAEWEAAAQEWWKRHIVEQNSFTAAPRAYHRFGGA